MEASTAQHTVTRHRALVTDFLAQKSIAVIGVSHEKRSPANGILDRFRAAGYHVFPVNPTLDAYDGVPCYESVMEIHEAVDGAVIVTRPEVTEEVVDACIRRGIPRIWIHNMLGTDVRVGRNVSATMTSASESAVRRAEAAGIAVIAGGCPLQHIEPVDPFHRCVYWAASRMGNYGARV